jgi:predicted nucleic acid-binding protein
VVKSAITFADAMLALTTSLAAPEHQFWPLDYPIREIIPELRIASHLHLNDALLLDLAIRHGGKLVTFDRRMASLLRPESPHRNAIEILPIE